MKLHNVTDIRVAHFPEGPMATPARSISGKPEANGPIWPEHVIAHIAVEVFDDVIPDGEGPREASFVVEFKCPSTETLATIERLALRQLASDLAALSEDVARAAEAE
ncbi:hypothetical protein [Rhodovulum sulfidophilum]|uniref:Uncharacterized protein n=1 Tax=Rhodovulum sulfidophilum TaxID=35806 RepID=A0ABS1RVX6_RHOSU|nr:hypothetical protein [Rhodovulum sulfidophilum]MBL3610078.1 hypothetical protein [Rhodovulum sulfidophilum]MCE8457286.1 hypothetical protein [Rhodovulum sulfidophilum]